MKTLSRMALLVAVGLGAPAAATAEPLRYWGKHGNAATGWIDVGHGALYEIGAGTEVAAWGRVREVRDDRVVVERVLTESEKRAVRERGGQAHDVIEIHVLREDLRYAWVTAPRMPRR